MQLSHGSIQRGVGSGLSEGGQNVKQAPVKDFRRESEMCRQCGALCWREVKGKVQVLLVTSRDTGRWVIPKGWLIPGLDEAGSAAREAWEEAGVKGTIAPEPLGWFIYDKVLSRDTPVPDVVSCTVSVFALQVDDLARRFPEASQRKQRWFSAAKAAQKVDEPGLRALIAGFAALKAPTRPAKGG